MSKRTRPIDPELQNVVVQAQMTDAHRRREMGVIGGFIGGGAEKPGNVAYFAIVYSFTVILVICFLPDSPSLPKRELFTLFGGIVTSALGFLFGRSTRR